MSDLDDLHRDLERAAAAVLDSYMESTPDPDTVRYALQAGASLAVQIVAPRVAGERWRTQIVLWQPPCTSLPLAGLDAFDACTH